VDVTVIVATFGDDYWDFVGDQAVENIHDVYPHVPTRRVHGLSLAAARNEGAARSDTEWLCFVDADDKLESGYLEAMEESYAAYENPQRHPLLAPRVRYDDGEVVSYETRSIGDMNPCVIGTLVTRQRFDEVGGFWEEPAWEDWSMFRRCWLIGSPVRHVAGAVYRARGGRTGSGRNIIDRPKALRAQILKSHRRWMEQR